jgi:hypothetical protein
MSNLAGCAFTAFGPRMTVGVAAGSHPRRTNFDTDTSMTIVINYRTLLWFWTGTKLFPVKAEKADDGTWGWKSE